MKMYEYKSVLVGDCLDLSSTEHREIITRKANKGFSYVGYVPTAVDEQGKLLKIDLIFEHDVGLLHKYTLE